MRRFFESGVLFVALALSTACGGGGAPPAAETTAVEEAPPRPTGPVSARGAEEVRASVGPAGGTLELGNGCRLVIPRGAIATETEVTFSNAAPARQVWTDSENERAMGPMVEIEPMLDAGEGRFEVSCASQPIPSPFEPTHLALGQEEEADRGRALAMGGTQTRWQFYPAHVAGNRFVSEMATLGGHRLQFGVSR